MVLKRKALRFNIITQQLEVLHNVRGSANFKEHQVSWDGNGVNGSWVKSMSKGDIIECIVRAEYPAWVNIVKSVELEILYEPERDSHNTVISHVTNSLNYVLLNSARQIRLILVHPGAFDDALNCSLIHSDLVSAKRTGFEATSYCWGDSTTQARINLEYTGKSSEFGISRSIEDILRSLRRSDGQVRTIWIDAICIDQSNDQERAQQVALMSEVYSAAETVNIWLGSYDLTTQLAFQIIRDIHNYQNRICAGGTKCICLGTAHTMIESDFQRLDKDFSNLHERMDAITTFHVQRESAEVRTRLRPIMYSHYLLISELFRNPWFKRVWVLQEVINSKRAILHCGMKSILWKELIEVDEHRNGYVPHLEPLYRLPEIWIHLGKLRNPEIFPSVRGTDEEQIQPAQELGILDVVLETLELNATDPRDKIFALLSFGQETSIISQLPKLIAPDYTKSVERVFADFTRWWIKEHKSLRILSMIHGNLGRTWQAMHCPTVDLPAPTKPTWTIRTEGMHSWTKATLESQFQFQASGDSALNTETLLNTLDSDPPDPLHLRLLGFKVAQIEGLSHFPLSGQTADAATLFEVYQSIFEPVVSHGRWKSLRKRETESTNRQQLIQMMSEHLRAHWQHESTEPLSLFDLNSVRGRGHGRVSSTVVFPCHGPCFFVASDGSVGLCPAAARAGDCIVIFLGGNVPFLLREVDTNGPEMSSHFELIGECYVEGKMKGEFMRDRESDGLEAERLTLV